MKTLYTLLFAILFTLTTNAQEFKFEKETIDYGKVAKGTDGKKTFTFTNIGDAPLIIEKVQPTCGCTIAKKPEKPVMPGEKGEIEISYDTNRLGGFSKTIIVFSNAKSKQKSIKIKGYVEKGISLAKEQKSIIEN
jgi:hypothetical protein